jgi:hypothetical protein
VANDEAAIIAKPKIVTVARQIATVTPTTQNQSPRRKVGPGLSNSNE